MPKEPKRHHELTPAQCMIIVLGIVCITALEITAMITGIDGKAFGIVVAAIAGIVGGVAGFQLTNFLK
jgi:hypothetical protein